MKKKNKERVLRGTPRVGGGREGASTWLGLPGSRTFCTMLLFSNPQLLLYQELGSRGGWDGSVGSTHTERGYGTPLEPSPPSIIRWLPRTQQDRRNANVRIVQRYVIVIRDRTSTRSNALIANLPAESPDEFAPDCNCSRATLNFAIERIDRTEIEHENSLSRILIKGSRQRRFHPLL